ncbi:uncharacterized protein LOC133832434 [Humulus lupulus]|uniref:uncharacterized protein LOC133832434 n=1 Tax=Humulus lupulus TaxID=3486 RepID=UPI002B404F32|nr:uncharacterized protein LOC133832434 [Humulus lupulus]
MSWLYASLSDGMLNQIIHFQTASAIWASLEQIYIAASFAWVSEVRTTLQNIKKEGLTTFAYLQKLTSLCNTLASLDNPVSPQDHLIYLLNGLGSDYNAFVTSIQARSMKPSIEEVHSLLLSHDARLDRQNADANLSSLHVNFSNLQLPKSMPRIITPTSSAPPYPTRVPHRPPFPKHYPSPCPTSS